MARRSSDYWSPCTLALLKTSTGPGTPSRRLPSSLECHILRFLLYSDSLLKVATISTHSKSNFAHALRCWLSQRRSCCLTQTSCNHGLDTQSLSAWSCSGTGTGRRSPRIALHSSTERTAFAIVSSRGSTGKLWSGSRHWSFRGQRLPWSTPKQSWLGVRSCTSTSQAVTTGRPNSERGAWWTSITSLLSIKWDSLPPSLAQSGLAWGSPKRSACLGPAARIRKSKCPSTSLISDFSASRRTCARTWSQPLSPTTMAGCLFWSWTISGHTTTGTVS